jgi:hypothetical protein
MPTWISRWKVYRSSVGSSGVVIARQDDATIEYIKGEFDSLAARYATGDGAVALPASAVIVNGTRPLGLPGRLGAALQLPCGLEGVLDGARIPAGEVGDDHHVPGVPGR